MAWETSDRRERLPVNWPQLRHECLSRAGGQCVWVDIIEGKRTRCQEPAVEVDHRIPGDDHRIENLQALCHKHHERKTLREAARGRSKHRAEIRKRFARKPEEHPAYAYMKRLKEGT